MELRERWPDPEAEYQVLADFIVPATQARVERWMQDWDALDTKILGILAFDAAIVAGLVAVQDSLHNRWWIPAVGLALAGVLFIAAVWPRRVDVGADLVDFHDELRESDPLEAARTMANALLAASDGAAGAMAGKIRFFYGGLGLLAISMVGCLPVVLFRP